MGQQAEVESRGSSYQGGASDREAQDRSKLLGETTEGRADELKGASSDWAAELDGLSRGEGSGRLGGTSSNKGDMEPDGTSSDWRFWGMSSKSSYHSLCIGHSSRSAVVVWTRLHSMPSNSTNIPSEVNRDTSSHIWSDSAGLGSGSVLGCDSLSKHVEGSRFSLRDEHWLRLELLDGHKGQLTHPVRFGYPWLWVCGGCVDVLNGFRFCYVLGQGHQLWIGKIWRHWRMASCQAKLSTSGKSSGS